MKIFHCLAIECPAAFSDIAVAMCHDCGTIGVEEVGRVRGRASIRAYFRARSNTALLRKQIVKKAPRPTTARCSIVEEQDWLREFRRHLRPLKIGKKLVIAPEPGVVSTGRQVLYVPYERAFGTGSHATTRRCLELIEELLVPGQSVLDVGAGSGILAMAAAKLGAGHVDALDTDREAVSIARQNVLRNALVDRIRIIHGGLASVSRRRYHLILANLTAETLVALMPRMSAALRAGGRAILAGILAGPQAANVQRASASAGLQAVQEYVDEEWVAIVLGKTDRRSQGETGSLRSPSGPGSRE